LERERVTVQEAARRLGITESAVRKRATRRQLRSEKVMEGKRNRLYIFLDTDQDKFQESFRERYVRSMEDQRSSDTTALISAKDETIAALREQLEQANERDRENRRIIAALTSRIPELPAAASPASEEPEESPETSREHGGTFKVIDAHSDRPGAREPPESSENVADEQQG
jgi:hypothetical protein